MLCMKKTKKGLYLLGAYCIIVIIFFLLSLYLKEIITNPDEILYYSIANSLIHGHGIEVYNVSDNFQKVLYSVVISPAFLTTNPVLRIRLIALINSIVICSGIFPTYLLAKRLLKNKKLIISVCVLFCVFSDLTYAMSFMSEVLFLPMGLWAVYFTDKMFVKTTSFIDSNERVNISIKYIICAFLLGFYYYLVYMCKEVGAVFPVAFALCWFAYFIHGLKTHVIDKVRLKILLLQFVFVCFGFFAILGILEFVMFAGNGSIYNIADTSVYTDLFNIYYVNYGTVYFISMTIFAYGIFPIVYPLLNWRKLERKDLNFLLYILLLLVMSAIVVSYKISAGENQGQTTPRIHLRYICYLFLPYVIIMLNAYEHGAKTKIKNLLITISALSAWYLLIAFTSFQIIVSYEDFVDHTMLQYMSQNMNYQMLILCIYLVVMFIIGILICKKEKTGIIFALCALVGLNVWNDVLTIEHRKYINSCDSKQDITEIEWLSNFTSEHSNQNILVLSDGGRKSLFLATYEDERNVFTLDYDSYYAYFENTIPNQENWNDVQQNVHVPRSNSKYATLTGVNYIILVDSINTTLDDANATLVDSPLTEAKIYALKDSSKIPNLTFHTKVLHAN